MRRWLTGLAALILIGTALALGLTRPRHLDAAAVAAVAPDLARGAYLFDAAGCASCHAAPEATGDARLVLAGGRRFSTTFGTFVAPNISPDPKAGIGDWPLAEIADAVMLGSGRHRHLYPVLPYPEYGRARLADIVSLAAYQKTLPPDPTPSQPQEIGFLFNIRAGLGLWKWLYAGRGWVLADPADPQTERGRYLVEALGHCGECHTPRTLLGGLDRSRWLGGAPDPSGKGRIPNISPGGLDWSADDIASFLETGLKPDFDSAGSSMAEVIRNTARLTPEDRGAIAAYLKAIPPVR